MAEVVTEMVVAVEEAVIAVAQIDAVAIAVTGNRDWRP
jgi:hypothetical protein